MSNPSVTPAVNGQTSVGEGGQLSQGSTENEISRQQLSTGDAGVTTRRMAALSGNDGIETQEPGS